MKQSLVPLVSLLCLSGAAASAAPAIHAPTPEELALAKKYAPLIVLAKDEKYLPSSIEFFAPNVHFTGGGLSGTITNPQGALSGDNHLTTVQKMSGPDQILPFFHGQDPGKAPVPVYVSFYKAASGALNVQYMTLWPYNWGKNVCLSAAPKDHCLAKRHQMDNHVGDWEGMTIQLKGDKLVGVRVGAHSASSIGFTFKAGAGGKCPNEGGSGDLNKTFPLSCVELRGTHPVVYSAWGSHGIWGTPGDHNYQTLPTGERLVDHTSKGIEWHTERAQVVYDDGKYPFKFKGRWGNLSAEAPHNKNACKMSPSPKVLCGPLGIPQDEFELNPGPGTPDGNRDWEKLQ